MTVLCLDLGINTGWAAKLESGHIESGSVSFQGKRHEGGGMRYLKFRRWLDDEFKGCASEVYFEEVRGHRGTTAAHIYGGFMAQLTAWCEANKIPYSSVPVKTIKKAATGNGNASKEQMINAAILHGFNVADDDQADAIHLLRYVTEQL